VYSLGNDGIMNIGKITSVSNNAFILGNLWFHHSDVFLLNMGLKWFILSYLNSISHKHLMQFIK
jgi:hypothetical protein